MIRTIAAATAGSLLLPLAASSPAHAANEMLVTMPGGVLYDSCGHYGYTATGTLPAGYTYRWDMDLELVGPDGNEVDTDYLYSGSTSSREFFLCQSPNLAGTYTIRGTGEACDSDYDCVPISASGVTTFRLPQTRTTLTAKPRKPANGQVVRFAVTSKDERPAGYFGTSYASVRLQVRRAGAWKTIDKSMTNDSGKVVVKARYSGRPVKVRAVTEGSSDLVGSVSRTIRVG